MSLPCVLLISSPSQVVAGSPFLVSGSLKETMGNPIVGALIHVYANYLNEVASGLTDSSGEYAISAVVPNPGVYDLYAGFLGDLTYLSANSMIITLTVSESPTGGGSVFPLLILGGFIALGYLSYRKSQTKIP